MAVLFTPRHGEIELPFWVNDLDSFRRWVHSGELPEKLKVHFIDGQVWVDFVEEAFSHNQIKLAVTLTVGGFVRAEKLGRVFVDGMLLTNEYAQLACEPDLVFVSAGSFASGLVTFTAGAGGFFASPTAPNFYNGASASFINAEGTVTPTANGFMVDNGGGSVNFATPIPEPETYALMLAGLGAMGFVGRRRK